MSEARSSKIPVLKIFYILLLEPITLYIVDIWCMHLAEILGVYISYSNSVILSIGTIYRFDGSGNEIKLAKLPVLRLTFPLAFLLYLHSFNLFYRRAIKRERKCFHSCCRRENAPQEAATAPPSRSHHVTAPSVWCATHRSIYWCHHWSWRVLLHNGGGGTEYGSVTSAVW